MLYLRPSRALRSFPGEPSWTRGNGALVGVKKSVQRPWEKEGGRFCSATERSTTSNVPLTAAAESAEGAPTPPQLGSRFVYRSLWNYGMLISWKISVESAVLQHAAAALSAEASERRRA